MSQDKKPKQFDKDRKTADRQNKIRNVNSSRVRDRTEKNRGYDWRLTKRARRALQKKGGEENMVQVGIVTSVKKVPGSDEGEEKTK